MPPSSSLRIAKMRRAAVLGGLLRQLGETSRSASHPAASACLQTTAAASADALADFRSASAAPPCRHLGTSRAAAAPLHIEDEPYNRQRQLIALGNRLPTMAPDTWVAPDAVIIGDVDLYDRVSVWSGVVIRGDLNSIRVNAFSSIGDRSVLHAARSSPTGLPASTIIGRYVVVGQGCLLRSCQVQHEAVIGDRSILLEGSVVERQSVLAPGSLLPPGRLIPRGQLWAGCPARYVRDLSADEKASIKELAESLFPLVDARVDETLPNSEAYREAEAVRAALIAKSPEYSALLSGWEDTEATPDDL